MDPESILAAFERGGIDLPIDYEHQTLTASDKNGPVPAAGWIEALELRDGALWGRVRWTQTAATLIGSREYRFLSPVFRAEEGGRVISLEGAGLTHYPNLDLAPVAHNKGVSMTDLATLAQTLGAPADADVAALVAHAQTLREAAARQPDPLEWVPMAQHKAVAEQLAALQAEVAREKAEAAVRAAMSAGKLAPAMQDWALGYAAKDPEGFAAWCDKAPVILPPVGMQSHRVAPNADTLTDEDRYVCAALGLTEADFAEHKKARVERRA